MNLKASITIKTTTNFRYFRNRTEPMPFPVDETTLANYLSQFTSPGYSPARKKLRKTLFSILDAFCDYMESNDKSKRVDKE